jgi:hypothetical protein
MLRAAQPAGSAEKCGRLWCVTAALKGWCLTPYIHPTARASRAVHCTVRWSSGGPVKEAVMCTKTTRHEREPPSLEVVGSSALQQRTAAQSPPST